MNIYNTEIHNLNELFQDSLHNRRQIENCLKELVKKGFTEEDIDQTSLNYNWLRYSDDSIHLWCQYIERMIREEKIEHNIEMYFLRLTLNYLQIRCYDRAAFWAKKMKMCEKYNIDLLGIENIVLFEKNKNVRFSYDSRLDNKFVIYMMDGIQNLIENNCTTFYPIPHFVLVYGSGPSPFNAVRKTAYMMLNRYNKTVHDKEIFQYSILHELQHYKIYDTRPPNYRDAHKEVIKKSNNFKFYDEGLAIASAYKGINKWDGYRIEDDNISRSIFKFSRVSLNEIREKWIEYLFNRKYLSTYSYGHSFMAVLIDNYGADACNDFVSLCLDQSVNCIEEIFHNCFKLELNEMVEKWQREVLEKPIIHNEVFFQITSIYQQDGYTYLYYESKYPLWPEKHVKLVNDNYMIISLTQINEKRYQKIGKLKVATADLCESMTFYIFYKKKSQILDYRLGKKC